MSRFWQSASEEPSHIEMAAVVSVSGLTWHAGHVTVSGEQVPLRVHVLLGAVPAMACVSVLARGGSFAETFLTFVATGPLLFGTVLVHEIGHLVQAARRGATPVEILLWPLGGLAITANSSSDPTDRIAISASGPATHVPMALVWLIIASFAKSASTFFYALATYTLWLNVYMCAFNLLVPCFPLDCSQILCSYMILRGKSPMDTARLITAISVPFVAVLLFWGAWTFVATGSGALTVFLAVWMAHQTYNLAMAAKEGNLTDHPLFRNPPRAPDPSPPPATFSPMVHHVVGNECACGFGPSVVLATLASCAACAM